jgi:hypothetical protein
MNEQTATKCGILSDKQSAVPMVAQKQNSGSDGWSVLAELISKLDEIEQQALLWLEPAEQMEKV